MQNEYLRIFFHFESDISSVPIHQFAFSAPKRLCPNATDRNYIKRLLREAVRKNKSELITPFTNKTGSFFISYVHKEKPNFSIIENSLLTLFNKIKKIAGL